MKLIDEIAVSGDTALGYREWTVIGAIAKALDGLKSGDGVLVGKVVDVTGKELPLENIRMNLSKIAKDNGFKVFTRKKGEHLMIGLL